MVAVFKVHEYLSECNLICVYVCVCVWLEAVFSALKKNHVLSVLTCYIIMQGCLGEFSLSDMASIAFIWGY